MKTWQYGFILPVILMSCRTSEIVSENSSFVSHADLQSESGLSGNKLRENYEYCNEWSSLSCRGDIGVMAPHLCTVSLWSASTIETISNVQQIRGDNYCAVMQELKDNFCRSDVASNDLKMKVDCAPDATQGECPPKDTVCERGNNEEVSMTCVVDTYDGDKVPENYRLKVVGTNECAMKFSLKKQACSLNLKPSLLGQTICQ